MEQIDRLIEDDNRRHVEGERYDARLNHYVNVLIPLTEEYRIGLIRELRDMEPNGDELATELIKRFWVGDEYEDIYQEVIAS